MKKHRITEKQIRHYQLYLQHEEKSRATVEKYTRDIRAFTSFLSGRRISREQVLAYKQHLTGHYKAASVNSMLSALNSFLFWQGLAGLRVKPLKIQRQIFRPLEKELTKEDYSKLLNAAGQMPNKRLYLIMQTICATGIRISELSFITAERLHEGCIQVSCKNKTRMIWIPNALARQLLVYVKKEGITTGPVFITSTGKAVGRGSVWKQIQAVPFSPISCRMALN